MNQACIMIWDGVLGDHQQLSASAKFRARIVAGDKRDERDHVASYSASRPGVFSEQHTFSGQDLEIEFTEWHVNTSYARTSCVGLIHAYWGTSSITYWVDLPAPYPLRYLDICTDTSPKIFS
jgi:hypothetical protein